MKRKSGNNECKLNRNNPYPVLFIKIKDEPVINIEIGGNNEISNIIDTSLDEILWQRIQINRLLKAISIHLNHHQNL